MNIDEYRAMKADMEKETEADAQVQQGSTTAVEEVVPQADKEPGASEASSAEQETQAVPSDIEAIKAENARLMTEQQQIAQALKEAEEAKVWYSKINEDPEYAKAFAESKGLQYIDPESKAVKQMESHYQSLLLERDIQMLSTKYDDFNAQEVIQVALNKNIGNLEDAYIIHKASKGSITKAPDMDAIREQIRQEIQNELQSNLSTTSVIGSGGAGSQSVQPTDIELSNAELKIAKNMGLTPKEYNTWKTRK